MYGETSEAQVREQGAIRERCGPKFGVVIMIHTDRLCHDIAA